MVTDRLCHLTDHSVERLVRVDARTVQGRRSRLSLRQDGRGGWVVVDFKTDRERGSKVTHSVQLAIYARAVAAATGEPVETVLLYV